MNAGKNLPQVNGTPRTPVLDEEVMVGLDLTENVGTGKNEKWAEKSRNDKDAPQTDRMTESYYQICLL